MPSILASASYTSTRWTWQTDTSRIVSAIAPRSKYGSRSNTDHLRRVRNVQARLFTLGARTHIAFEFAALTKHLADELDAECERVKKEIVATVNGLDIASWFRPTGESPEWVNILPGEDGPIFGQ